MNRTTVITSILLVIASSAFAQSDEEILKTLRTSITKVYLEGLPNELPGSFYESGLAPVDKERIVRQLANDCATCFVDAVVAYAAQNDIPLSDFVADGVVTPVGESVVTFEQLLNPCILAARQAVGVTE